jgi:protein TonB
MFEQITLADGARRTKPWSFAASVTLQSILVGAALTLPMLHVANLETKIPVGLFLPRALGAREPVRQTPQRNAASSATLLTQLTQPGRTYKPFQAPSRIPTSVATGPDLPGAPEYAFGSGTGGTGVMNGLDIPGLPDIGQRGLLPAPPSEPPRGVPHPAAAQAPVRVTEGVQAAKLIYGPKPTYPPLAKQARISGTVRLAAQISADGHIKGLRVVSGHPMLIASAIEAVREWVYHPTLLNGQPVEVLTDIQVNFVLQ